MSLLHWYQQTERNPSFTGGWQDNVVQYFAASAFTGSLLQAFFSVEYEDYLPYDRYSLPLAQGLKALH